LHDINRQSNQSAKKPALQYAPLLTFYMFKTIILTFPCAAAKIGDGDSRRDRWLRYAFE